FVVLAADGDGAVATDAAADAGSERRAQLRLVEGVGGRGRVLPRGRRRAAEQPGVRRLMVVDVEEGEQADVDVVQGRQAAQKVDAALPQGAPEAFHLPARGRVVGPGVQQCRADAGAGGGERLAAVRGAVVEVQRIGRAVA